MLCNVCSIHVFSVKTTAKRVGDDLVINGQKMWITNAFQGKCNVYWDKTKFLYVYFNFSGLDMLTSQYKHR